MDKSVLKDYIDTCELIKETRQEITRLKNKQHSVLQDTVSGSNPEFPYERRTFKVMGTSFTYLDDARLSRAETILESRLEALEEKRIAVEEWMNTIPSRMQRIIRYRIFQSLPWEMVADKMGRDVSGEAVRMELARFLDSDPAD